MSSIDQRAPNNLPRNPGPYLAEIVDAIDPEYMGVLKVKILQV